MSSDAKHLFLHPSNSRRDGPATPLPIAMLSLMLISLLTVFGQLTFAQSFQVIYAFRGTADGRYPHSGVFIDSVGNIYGTTSHGGPTDGGVAYRLSFRNSAWVLNPLDEFPTFNNGSMPDGGLVQDASGALYGTTKYGGIGAGLVYKLTPPPSTPGAVIVPWTETVLHRFTGGADGRWPYGPLVFDSAGNLFGTTSRGAMGSGTVFKMTPSGSDWILNTIYTFTDGGDRGGPAYNLLIDSAGNIYGTTLGGGEDGCGTIFELSPAGDAWIETVLHSFSGHGCGPIEGLIMDEAGSLYGATFMYDSIEATFHSTVYRLSKDNGNWTFSVIAEPPMQNPRFVCSWNPVTGTLAMDAGGNIYGTMLGAGIYGYGSIFRLTRTNETWTYRSLHDFNYDTELISDVCTGVALDLQGNLYGTAWGGVHDVGVVWEITP